MYNNSSLLTLVSELGELVTWSDVEVGDRGWIPVDAEIGIIQIIGWLIDWKYKVENNNTLL